MRILLFQAPDDFKSPGNLKNLPLSLGIIISYLKKHNYSVSAFDLNERICKHYSKTPGEKWIELYNKDFFLDCLENNDKVEVIWDLYKHILVGIDFNEYDFVGISMGTYGSFFEIHTSCLLGKLIQTKFNIPVVFGGINVGLFIFNNLYKEVLEIFFRNFKYMLVGPAEKSLVTLLQSYEDGSINEVYPTLKGAVLFSEGKIITNDTDSPTFTCPDYKEFNPNFYKIYLAGRNEDENVRQLYKTCFPFNLGISGFVRSLTREDSNYTVVIPYFFNQNCPYKCAFCTQSGNTAKPIIKETQEIIEDIFFLKKQYNSKYFQFLNNVINFTPAFVREFCTILIEKEINIYWSDCARFNGMTKELIEYMYKAGCRKLVFGFETGSKKLLKYVNKNLDLVHVSEVLKWCSEIGIYAEIEVIVGLPYENEEDFNATLSFIHNNKKYINCIYPTRFFLIKHTSMERYPEKYGIELIRVSTYDSMLAWVRQLRLKNFQPDLKEIGKIHYHILKFNEINGRPHELVEKDTHERFLKMMTLNFELPGFTEVEVIKNNLRNRINV